MNAKMEFSSLVRIIHNCCGTNLKPDLFLIELIDNMLMDETKNPIAGVSSNYLDKIYNGSRNISKTSATKICARFDSRKLGKYFSSLGTDSLSCIEMSIRNTVPDFEINDSYGYELSQLLYDSLKTISETPRKSSTGNHNNTKGNKKSNATPNEADMIEARKFILRHEKEKSLIPLCQIAFLYNPTHNHVRSMYTEFCLLPFNIRKLILDQCGIINMIDMNELRWMEGLSLLINDLKEYDLSTDRYIYLVGQYFVKGYNYAAHSINKYNEYSFDRLIVSKANRSIPRALKSSINSYIDDYLFLKDRSETRGVVRPLDYMVLSQDLTNCDEETLIFWLCRFVIDIYINLRYRLTDEPKELECYGEDAESFEDFYYIALYALELHYLNHNMKNQERS